MRKEATHTTQAATRLKQRKHSIHMPLVEAVLLALLVFLTVGGLTQ